MPTTFFPTPPSPVLALPPCPSCGTPMALNRIEPEKPGHEIRTFECLHCGTTENLVVKFR